MNFTAKLIFRDLAGITIKTYVDIASFFANPSLSPANDPSNSDFGPDYNSLRAGERVELYGLHYEIDRIFTVTRDLGQAKSKNNTEQGTYNFFVVYVVKPV